MDCLVTEYELPWLYQLRNVLANDQSSRITFLGVGNPIKGDDSVGIYIISKLRRKVGGRPKKSVRVEPASFQIERLFSKTNGTTIIFDAVETNSDPGFVYFAKLEDAKYGFFATHNVPLMLVPEISRNLGRIYVLGVQPEINGIDESLSDKVRSSADVIVDVVSKLIDGME